MVSDAHPQPPDDCADCKRVDRKGYCALGRCYCGHSTCPGFASYVDMSAIPVRGGATTGAKHKTSWSEREGATWIDSL